MAGLFAAAGCGAEPPRPRPPRAGGPRDAAEIAIDIVGGKAWSLYHIDRARYSSAGRLVRSVDGVGYFLDRAGLEARSDIDRAFAVAPEIYSTDSVQVLQHSLSQKRAGAAIQAVVDGSDPPAELVAELGFPAAKVQLGSLRRVIAAPAPGLLVIAPDWAASATRRFADSNGLPEPAEGEMCVMFAEQPYRTVENIPFPETFSEAKVSAELDALGGTSVAFVARSLDAEQAARDAELCARRSEEALSIDLLLVELKVLGPFAFRADQSFVRCEFHLTREELDWVTGMTLLTTPGG